MLLYAKRGVADWKNAASDLKQRAQGCLGISIAENDAEVGITLGTRGADLSKLRIIPMPNHPQQRGFERSFFIPIQETAQDGSIAVTFDLFLLVGDKNCLAFRLEAAHPAGQTHDYGHIQLCQTLLRKSVKAATLNWMPESYPAFPTSTSDPVKLFLYMATAVHGHSNGVLTVLADIFRAAGHPGHAVVYGGLLKELLGL
jgi:hypothetical protein